MPPVSSAERASEAKARRGWLYLYSLLNHVSHAEDQPAPAVDASVAAAAAVEEAAKAEEANKAKIAAAVADKAASAWDWLQLKGSDAWVMDASVNCSAHATPAHTLLSGLFSTIDEFVRLSKLGEFQSRLALLRSFACHARVQHALLRASTYAHPEGLEGAWSRSIVYAGNNPGGRDVEEGAEAASLEDHAEEAEARLQLSNILYHVYRFYGQHLGAVRAALSSSRAPCEKELKDQTKLAKWDEQTYYSLVEASNKSHRMLHRIVRRYSEGLSAPSAPVVSRDIDGGTGVRGDAAAALGLGAALGGTGEGTGGGTGVSFSDLHQLAETANTTTTTPSWWCDVAEDMPLLQPLLPATAAVQRAWGMRDCELDSHQPTVYHARLPQLASRVARHVTRSLLFGDDLEPGSAGEAKGQSRKQPLLQHIWAVGAESVEDLSTLIITRAQQLAVDTPSAAAVAMEKEKAAAAAAAAEEEGVAAAPVKPPPRVVTKMEKKRALLQLLRQLKEQGLPAGTSGVPQAQKAMLPVLSLPVPRVAECRALWLQLAEDNKRAAEFAADRKKVARRANRILQQQRRRQQRLKRTLAAAEAREAAARAAHSAAEATEGTDPRKLASAAEAVAAAAQARQTADEAAAAAAAADAPSSESSEVVEERAPPESVRDAWSRADEYFYRCLSQLQRLRLAATKRVNPDLNAREVSSGLGHSEQLMRLLIQQRTMLTALCEQYNQLDHALRQLPLLSSLPSSALMTAAAMDESQTASLSGPTLQTRLRERRSALEAVGTALQELRALFVARQQARPLVPEEEQRQGAMVEGEAAEAASAPYSSAAPSQSISDSLSVVLHEVDAAPALAAAVSDLTRLSGAVGEAACALSSFLGDTAVVRGAVLPRASADTTSVSGRECACSCCEALPPPPPTPNSPVLLSHTVAQALQGCNVVLQDAESRVSALSTGCASLLPRGVCDSLLLLLRSVCNAEATSTNAAEASAAECASGEGVTPAAHPSCAADGDAAFISHFNGLHTKAVRRRPSALTFCVTSPPPP